ncbi:erythromycin esterase family protein [Candidatus Amarobacter glycogenicus]|uniref:erythromycin esterase family protein n=1 Tax=Candidatus Amarobacter glycogenicus TaxID=3140699 RepID=UPI002A14ADCA|nr:erythromycin esterase family protein [Dehalococcoidia bacterium]
MDDFWVLIMDNLLAANQEFKDIDIGHKNYQVRDLQMAKNITWLKNVKYGDEKIIIWAHNYHISKQYMDETEKYYGETSMGGYMSLDTALIAQTYVLGFTPYNGTTGRILTTVFITPKTKSVALKAGWMKPIIMDLLTLKISRVTTIRNS